MKLSRQMRYARVRARLNALQVVRRKVEALLELGLVTHDEWSAFNDVFSDELTRVLDAEAKAKRKP